MTTRSRMKIQKKSEDHGDNDRISSLPRNVIDLILKRLRMRGIARMSILSTKWRYIWAEHPYLVFDWGFWYDLEQHNLSSKDNIDFAGIVSRILLHHTGNIEQFIVDISFVPPQQHSDINLWLALASKRGVKILHLVNDRESGPYIIPSCVFSAPCLTKLRLKGCKAKSKAKETCFSRLQSLTLENMELDSSLTAPLLTSLELSCCHGIHGFSISAPKLESLVFRFNDLNLIPYLMCTNITFAYIFIDSLVDYEVLENIDSEINLLLLHCCWRNLTTFVLNGPALKNLTTGIVLENLSFVLNLRCFRVFSLYEDQIDWVLCILRNSPWLQNLQIHFHQDSKNFIGALKYLDEPSIMNHRLEQPQTVNFSKFSGSKCELLLVKILLHCSPSLKQMVLEEFYFNERVGIFEEFYFNERVGIFKELLRFPRASTKAEITFGDFGAWSYRGKWQPSQ